MATPNSLTVPLDVSELVYVALVYALPHLPYAAKANLTKIAQQYDRDRKAALFAKEKIPAQAVDIYSKQAASKLRKYLQGGEPMENAADFKQWAEELRDDDPA